MLTPHRVNKQLGPNLVLLHDVASKLFLVVKTSLLTEWTEEAIVFRMKVFKVLHIPGDAFQFNVAPLARPADVLGPRGAGQGGGFIDGVRRLVFDLFKWRLKIKQKVFCQFKLKNRNELKRDFYYFLKKQMNMF